MIISSWFVCWLVELPLQSGPLLQSHLLVAVIANGSVCLVPGELASVLTWKQGISKARVNYISSGLS